MPGQIFIVDPLSDFDCHIVTNLGSAGGNVIDMAGSKVGPSLLKVYGRVYEDPDWDLMPDDNDIIQKPFAWHDFNNIGTTGGTISGFQFWVNDVPVPNMVPQGKRYTAFAWGDFYGERGYAMTKRHFWGAYDCGSDAPVSMSIAAQKLDLRQLTPLQMSLLTDAGSESRNGPHGSQTRAGILSTGTELRLNRLPVDPEGCTACWTTPPQQDGTVWFVQLVADDESARGTITCSSGGKQIAIWKCQRWDFLGTNRFTRADANGSASNGRFPQNLQLIPAASRNGHTATILLGSDQSNGHATSPVISHGETQMMEERSELGEFLNTHALTGKGAEIGVERCEFSEEILRTWKGQQLWLVDRRFTEKKELGDRVQFIEKPSVEAAGQFADHSLDFVYIDADHTFEAVREDLRAWYPKVVPGGLVCGHDYLNSSDLPQPRRRPIPLADADLPEDVRSFPFAAKRAVDEFAAELGVRVHQTHDEHRSPSWYFFKPYRFVTTLEESYVPGFLALAQSMKENAGIAFEFMVVLYSPLSQASHDQIERLGIPVRFIPKEMLGTFEFDRTLTDTPRMAPNFDKILIWNLPCEEPVCYVDSDMLCLNSLQGIHRFQSLSVCITQSSIGHEVDEQSAYRPSGRYPFNAGLMIFRPSPEIFQEIQQYARTYQSAIRFGDQVIQNDYFAEKRPEMIRYIDLNWNMSAWVSQKYPWLYDESKIRFLHFAQPSKPWKDEPSHNWMRRHWTLWESYYNRAIGKARQNGTSTAPHAPDGKSPCGCGSTNSARLRPRQHASSLK